MRVEIDRDCICGKDGPHNNIKNHRPRYYTKIKFCCKEMENAMEEKFISVGDYEEGISGTNPIFEVNIYKCHPWPEGTCWDDMQIKYCPFCGKKIRVDFQIQFKGEVK